MSGWVDEWMGGWLHVCEKTYMSLKKVMALERSSLGMSWPILDSCNAIVVLLQCNRCQLKYCNAFGTQ
jgi:hypothetical protein